MTFEIKDLVDYRLDRVDAQRFGEGTSRGTPRLDTATRRLLPADVHVYQWDGGLMVPRLPAF
jgi:hypothetical protein